MAPWRGGSMSDVDFLTWKNSYSVCEALLDDEHRNIFAVINKLYLPMQGRSPGLAADKYLIALIESSQTHFRHEEKRLAGIAFSGLADHKSLHDEMSQWIVHLKANLMAVDRIGAMQFLKQWWLDHILNHDRHYAPFLIGERVWNNVDLNRE
jgi:hemerythrin